MRIHKHKVYMGYFSPPPSAGNFILQNKYIAYLFHFLADYVTPQKTEDAKRNFQVEFQTEIHFGWIWMRQKREIS